MASSRPGDRLDDAELEAMAKAMVPVCAICGGNSIELRVVVDEHGTVLDPPFTGREVHYGDLVCHVHRANTDSGEPVKVQEIV